jgi:hypothetical protein
MKIRDALALSMALAASTGAWLAPVSAQAAEERSSKDKSLAAAEAFEAGGRAFDRGDYRAAALSYETAFQLVPHAIAAYNAAFAWRKLGGEEAREADALAQALDPPGLPDEERALAGKRLAELEARLGKLSIAAPEGARISLRQLVGVEPPVIVHAPPGKVEVVIQLPGGRRVEREMVARAGETTRLEEKSAPPPPPRRAQPAASGETAGNPAMRIAGWTGVALAGALGATAIGLGVATLDAREEFDASNQAEGDAQAGASELREDAVALRTATNVAWFAAAGFAVAGSVLLIVEATQQGDRDVALSLRPDGAALRLRY